MPERRAPDVVPLDAMPDAVVVVDRDGLIVVANRQAEALFGYEAGGLVGRPLELLVPDAQRAAHEAHRDTFFERPRVRAMGAGMQLRARRRDGSAFAAEISLSPLHADSGLIAIAAVRDVSELQRVEPERERVLAALQEAQYVAQLGSWRWDPSSATRVWSAGMYEVYGYDPAAGPLDTEQSLALVHPDDLQRVKDAYAQMLAGAAGFELDYRLMTARGMRTVHAIARADPDELGCYRGTLQDVTALHQTEQALRELTEALGALLDSAPIGMAVTLPAGRFTRVNRALCELLGYSQEELLRMSLSDVTHPDDLATRLPESDLALARERSDGQLPRRYVHRDGRPIWARVSFAAAGEGGGETPRYLIAQVEDITTERAAAEALARLASVVESSYDAITTVTLDGTVTTWNAAAERIYGYSAQEMVGEPAAILAPAAIEQEMQGVLERVRRGERVEPFETVRQKRDGSLIDVSVTVSPIRDADGVVIGASAVARDITAVKQKADRTLAEAQDRFRSAFENAPIGMALSDLDGRYLQVNQALCEITGYTAQELCATSFHAITHPDDAVEDRELIEALLDGTLERYHREKRYVRASGKPVWVAVEATVLRDRSGRPQHFLAQVIDITQRQRLESELRHLAGHDPLTGLLNRRSLEAELDRQVAHANRYGAHGALLVLDLDHFKTVNDTLGHSAGDQLIISVAEILRHRLRASDVVARLGGDEFAILLPEADAATAQRVAEGIVRDVAQNAAVLSGQQPGHVSVSIGVTPLRKGLASGEEALVDADLAMYDAKEAGRGRVALYATDHHSQPRVKARLSWIQRIRGALDQHSFALDAQPIRELHTGYVRQYELLLRMPDETGAAVPPGAFIYIAERYDLIQELDRWVVTEAIRHLEQLKGDGRHLSFAVNISGKSLADERLPELIEAELKHSGVDPASLIFEVTETAAVANIKLARRFAERLATIGCSFALDDFGAGFGSFYYLKHLPFDYLKIDREFVTRCTTNRTDQLVIAALVAIAQGLHKQTIAEGVENRNTQQFLRTSGVDYAQGYHVGRPRPLAEARNP